MKDKNAKRGFFASVGLALEIVGGSLRLLRRYPVLVVPLIPVFLMVLGVEFGLLLCLPCSAISVFAGSALLLGGRSEPEHVNITVRAPRSVGQGERFVIKVQVENLADRPQSLHSIDVGLGYLEGFDIQKAEPPYAESSRFGSFQSYSFGQRIAPGDTFVVQFHATARQVGDWSGQFDVCVNRPANCLGFVAETAVGK